jgi:hypothetical protein
MRKLYSVLSTAILLSALAGCTSDEEEMIDLDNMVMEDEDILEQTPGADLFYSPQEIVIKELPEPQGVESQR